MMRRMCQRIAQRVPGLPCTDGHIFVIGRDLAADPARKVLEVKKAFENLVIGPLDKNNGELWGYCPKLYQKMLEKLYSAEAGYDTHDDTVSLFTRPVGSALLLPSFFFSRPPPLPCFLLSSVSRRPAPPLAWSIGRTLQVGPSGLCCEKVSS